MCSFCASPEPEDYSNTSDNSESSTNRLSPLPEVQHRKPFRFKYRKPSFSRPYPTAPTAASKQKSLSTTHFMNNLCKNFLPEILLDRTKDIMQTAALVSQMQLDVKNGDLFLDIRHYLKIKKIPGGVDSSKYIHGLVFTHSAYHSSFLKPKLEASILLLNFPLEYQRPGQYISMESLMSQETDYVRILVKRIKQCSPSIIISTKPITHRAMRAFIDMNITIIYGAKKSTLNALSRLTGAEICTSLERISTSILGKSASYKTYTFVNSLFEETRKSYVYITGKDENKENGGTILIRGSNIEILKLLKTTLRIFCFLFYNLRLESAILLDFFMSSRNISGRTIIIFVK